MLRFVKFVLLGESVWFAGDPGMVFSGVLANQINRAVVVLILLVGFVPFGFEFPV